MKRILVCGDRNWTQRSVILRTLGDLKVGPGVTIIHGDCRGADTMAGWAAALLGASVEAFPADWDTHGKKAGPIRNRQMLADGKPELVVAFHDCINDSRGTKHMLDAAEAAGVRCIVVDRWGGISDW